MSSSMEGFFAAPRRVKKEAATQPTEQVVEQTPTPVRVAAPIKTRPAQTQEVIAQEMATKAPVHTEAEYTPAQRYKAETKAQREYPERTFDKFSQKLIQINDSDWDMIREFSSEIRTAKRSLPKEMKQKQRMTENVIIRNLISVFSESLVAGALEHTDFRNVQSEEQVKDFIKQTLKF